KKFILAAIAGIVAMIGLFLNNIGIIIGAMLISPLLGPIYALAIYVAIGDVKTTVRCLEILGLMVIMLVSIAAAASFALSFVIDLPLTPEIMSRTDPHAVFILMAVLLGLATMIALSEGIPEGIAGVAIAAALLPPAVVTGISLALFPGGAVKAIVLTLQNVVGLIAGSIIGVMFLHIGPRDLFAQIQSRQVVTRVVWFLAILILFLVIISFLV
ncbi:MAG TPA: TIGR00341 family protein, partial [Methanoregulaceae archaeon]|nr:TIGR00341 family protein [Methanoregulaceae archaeon]